MTRLEGKIALVTGAANGIGKAIARLFVAEGATVIMSDIDDNVGESTQKELGANVIYCHHDVSYEKEWQGIMDSIKQRFGRLDILVNNAGINGFAHEFGNQDPEHASLESWHKVHAINLDSVFLGCKYGIALMKQFGGSIINISSRSGVVGIPHAAAYASSKAAIRNHSKTVALYCAERGYNIRCNTVLPAAITTAMWSHVFKDDDKHDIDTAKIAKDIPLRRMGTPLEVAYAVLYLASNESSYVTGAEIVVDGGILAGTTAASPRWQNHIQNE